MKKIFSSIILNNDYGEYKEAMAFNYKQYSMELVIEEFKKEFPNYKIKDYEPFVTWYRYITKQEVINDGDWEIIAGYEDGSMTLFLECEPTDVGAFKCWVIGD